MKIPFILKQLPELQIYFDNLRYNNRYQTYLAFNVKVHDALFVDASDLPDILTGKCSPEIKEFVLDTVNDKMIREQFDWWLSDSRDYFKEWIDGCSYSSASYWDEEIEKFKETGETCYYKGGEGRIKADLETLLKYKAESIKALKHLDHFSSDDISFLGRQGGWLCFEKYGKIDGEIADCFYHCDEGDDMGAYELFVGIWRYYKAVMFLETDVKSVIAGSKADFEYRLSENFTCSDFLETEGFVSEDDQIELRLQAIAI